MQAEHQGFCYTVRPNGAHFLLHSYDNQPALVKPNGYRAWYEDGVRQLVIYANGIQKHYTAGELTRIVWPDGAEVNLRRGRFHREDGPAVISHSGVCYWFLKGVRQKKG